MADLPTNYLDDILSDSMGGKRRFKITHLNGTSEEVTIEDISKYDQVGSTFGAGDINKTNQAVNEKFDSGDVVDPMLTTEPGFAADAYRTKLQFDEQNKKIAIVECVSPNVKDTYVHLSYPNGFNQNNCVIIGLNSRKWGTWYCESITNGAFGINVVLAQEVIDVGVAKEDGFNLPVKVTLCKMS